MVRAKSKRRKIAARRHSAQPGVDRKKRPRPHASPDKSAESSDDSTIDRSKESANQSRVPAAPPSRAELAHGPSARPHRVNSGKKPIIAFGPELPGIGSWEWVGADMVDALHAHYDLRTYRDQIPACDLLVIVKYNLPTDLVLQVARRAAVIFCPIDYYGSPSEIDRDAPMLRACARIIVHAECLRPYFQCYAPLESLDHHVKFTAPITASSPRGRARAANDVQLDDFILWVGMRTNLPPLVEWLNRDPLPLPLRVLTNLEVHEPENPDPRAFGFADLNDVLIDNWNPERQREWTGRARAALDIKGNDFRQRHKPPTKALDFIASGLPLAMNPDAHSVAHLARMGFDVASPDDPERWLSGEYREETRVFGRAVRELLSRERVARRFQRIIDDVLKERGVL